MPLIYIIQFSTHSRAHNQNIYHLTFGIHSYIYISTAPNLTHTSIHFNLKIVNPGYFKLFVQITYSLSYFANKYDVDSVRSHIFCIK